MMHMYKGVKMGPKFLNLEFLYKSDFSVVFFSSLDLRKPKETNFYFMSCFNGLKVNIGPYVKMNTIYFLKIKT
jgi:hypothetical protein